MIKIDDKTAQDTISLLEDFRMLAMENEDYVSDIEGTLEKIGNVKGTISKELHSG